MKDLYEYLNESVVNEMGMRVRNRNLSTMENDSTDALVKKYKLKFNPRTELYDCDSDIRVEKDLVRDGKLVIGFGTVNGDFLCHNNNLISLKGAPKEVSGSFYCNSNKLTSLEGAPQKVSRDFYCDNNNLTSLKGVPQNVGEDFYCGYNNLTSLEGAPQEVGKGFYCDDNKLTSLEGAPQNVGGIFDCTRNPNLIYDEEHFYGFLPDVIGRGLKADDKCDYKLAATYYDKK